MDDCGIAAACQEETVEIIEVSELFERRGTCRVSLSSTSMRNDALDIVAAVSELVRRLRVKLFV